MFLFGTIKWGNSDMKIIGAYTCRCVLRKQDQFFTYTSACLQQWTIYSTTVAQNSESLAGHTTYMYMYVLLNHRAQNQPLDK